MDCKKLFEYLKDNYILSKETYMINVYFRIHKDVIYNIDIDCKELYYGEAEASSGIGGTSLILTTRCGDNINQNIIKVYSKVGFIKAYSSFLEKIIDNITD